MTTMSRGGSRTPLLVRDTKAAILAASPACLLTLSLACFLAPLAATAPARAAFPGGNGKIAFERDFDIYVMNADGSGQMKLTSDDAGAGGQTPAWSPDGQRIAFTGYRDGNHEIHVMNADGSAQTRLTSNAVGDYAPAWSPDGERIVFSRSSDTSDIYVMNADGSDQTRLTSATAGGDFAPAWSPDGKRIVFTRDSDFYVMNADGSAQRRLAIAGPYQPAPNWSPDGKRIAFERHGIYVMNADGSGQTRLTSKTFHHAAFPSWSPDGTRIVFERNGIHAMSANSCGQTKLISNAHSPDWQPVPDSTGPSPPQPKCTRTVSLKYSEKMEKFKGELGSESQPCISEQKVSVYEQKGKKDRRLGSDRTRRSGIYSLEAENPAGRFYAKIERTTPYGTCRAAKSKTIKVG